jgi:hypothetical protein
MTVARTPDAYDQGEAPAWAWPLYAFVAWLAAMLDYVAKFKRIRHTQRFKPNWRDSWQDLRQCEWLRDQMIAQGLRQLLNGEELKLDDTKIQLDPPASYGGPCPRTPFDMNRRFLAIARWAADPQAIIRERFKRLATRLNLDPLSTHGSTGALRAAHHEAVDVAAPSCTGVRVVLMANSGRSARGVYPELVEGSNHEGVLANARGPPSFPCFRQSARPYPRSTRLPGAQPHVQPNSPATRKGNRIWLLESFPGSTREPFFLSKGSASQAKERFPGRPRITLRVSGVA